MGRLATRQTVGVLLMSLLLVLAGCNTGGQSPTTDAPTDAPAEGDGGGSDPGEIGLSTYEFTDGESYTYDSSLFGSTATETWTVVAVDGDDVTVEVTSSNGDTTKNTTITGTHSEIVRKAGRDEVAGMFVYARAPLAIAGMGDGSGQNFTVDGNELPTNSSVAGRTATVAPQGETTVNGIQCTEYVVVPEDSQQQLRTCVNEDYPFAVSMRGSQAGQTFLTMELVDSNRP
ncbi:hypothetical protein ACFR9U_09720 [Halorientalis brevis]|uniref:Lipoprotein n=1 Tax=Halorientalis brevis TaxID=1126241 RepID=A0ABD6CDF0_9EURY|nr:hypothetical protein [Halorientalis brevis]